VLHRFDLAIMLLPWAAGILLLMIWRAGPLKNWAVPWLISLVFPTIFLKSGLYLARIWSSHQGASPVSVWALFFVFPLAWYFGFLMRMSPRRCPGCGESALIPLMKLGTPDQRSSNTRWCAGCGGKYWKGRRGAWQEERRITWHDRRTDLSQSSGAIDHPIPPPKLESKNGAAPAALTTDAR
jgi:hypothetical protein